VSQELTRSERPELECGAPSHLRRPAAWVSADNFRLLEQIADKLGAAVGASLALRWMPDMWTNSYQVGQTGKIIAP